MRWIIGMTVLALMGIVVGGAVAANWKIQKDNPGPDSMVLYGGKTGNVPFPHRAHQAADPACEACHELFPQEKGAIRALQEKGVLNKKDAMKQCQKCHRAAKKANKPSGPIGCKDCHSIRG